MGALTSKPYAFRNRSWELKSVESIDFFDSLGSAINVHILGTKVSRILPLYNNFLNDNWINNKIRFFYDSLKYQRLLTPFIRKNNILTPVSWTYIYKFLINERSLNKNNIIVESLIGSFCDYKTLMYYRLMVSQLGCRSLGTNSDSIYVNGDLPLTYTFNTNFLNFEAIDFCIFLNTYMRYESPLLNYKLLNNLKVNNIIALSFGNFFNNSWVFNFGGSIDLFLKFLEGRNSFSIFMLTSKFPIIVQGSSLYNRYDHMFFSTLTHIFYKFRNFYNKDWNGINFLPKNISTVGMLDLGFYINRVKYFDWSLEVKKVKSKTKLWLYILDSFLFSSKNFLSKYDLVIYQGHHGCEESLISDIILPSTMPFEKLGYFMDMFRNLRFSNFVIPSHKDVKTDYKIIKSLSKIWFLCNFTFWRSYNSLYVFLLVNLFNENYLTIFKDNSSYYLNRKSILYMNSFNDFSNNYYTFDKIGKHSLVMNLCSKGLFKVNFNLI